MFIMDRLFVLLLLIIMGGKETCNHTPIETKCASPQYLEIDKMGIIDCLFDEVYSVLWYTEADFYNGYPTIQYQNNAVSGPGYESGEFDIQLNGSLIINEVELLHEQVFTVAYAQSDDDLYDTLKVCIIIVVKPDVPFPFIDQCEEVSDECHAEVVVPSIQCSVRGIRPNISLSLVTRTLYGDEVISNNTLVISEEAGYTNKVVANNIFRYSPRLVFLVCKAFSLPGLLEKYESKILLLNDIVNFTKVKPKLVSVKENKHFELSCSGETIGLVVWKKVKTLDYMDQELLAYSVNISKPFSKIFVSGFTLGDSLSLLFHSTQVQYEGMYFCMYGDGLRDDLIAYNVTIIIPAYPMINGCNKHQYCAQEAKHGGNLTCAVKGIRPRVQLQWKIFPGGDKTSFSFTSHKLTAIETNGTFDVTLVSKYHVKGNSHDKLTIGCEVVSSEKDLNGLTTKIDLLVIKGVDQTIPTTALDIPAIVIILVLVASGLLVGFFTSTVLVRLRKRTTSTAYIGNMDEMVAMREYSSPEAGTSSDLKEQFQQQLRVTYKDLYDGIQPIPHINDRFYGVERVFVEGGIEYLNTNGGAKGQWTRIDSYQNIFHDLTFTSSRCILEGDPGYGKSTLCLQFAYDWCTSNPDSVLRNVDVLVLLRLRQLGGVSSIYTAIKQFILPKDSQLLESDVKNILQESKSIVIILDGFDEYPDQDSSTSDIMSIIERHMFQTCEVFLTTRSSFLPRKYPPSTKRFRLTGFDDNARKYYIRNTVIGEDNGNGGEEIVKQIEENIQQNPILRDLFQVPLLFVMFAHITYENEQVLKLDSVTSFFRYMISCFHSHMRNKENIDTQNLSKYIHFETNHADLDRIAYDALSKNRQTLLWRKDELCQKMPPDFCERYIRTGILVEEKIIDIIDNPLATDLHCKTGVRFYHKVLCEWYAAHYLSDYIKLNPDINVSEYLDHIDKSDVQYLLRFSCGLNSNSAKKIVDYLNSIEGGQQIAVLCILEQTGASENFKEAIRQLCDVGVVISGHDSLLLQRSSVEVLEIAARHGVPIRNLTLCNCLNSVDLTTFRVKVTSNLSLSSKVPVESLLIALYNREWAKDETNAILQFAASCDRLQYLWLAGSVPPMHFKDGTTLSLLSKRNVTVIYSGVLEGSTGFVLNFRTGLWEKGTARKDQICGTTASCEVAKCTKEDFKTMESDCKKYGHEEDLNKKRVTKYREGLKAISCGVL